jgi:membrane protease YdiL (CAAX protease family)
LTAPLDPPSGESPPGRDDPGALPLDDDGRAVPQLQVGGDPTPPPLSTFSLEGRATPALYLLGWIGSVMGLAILMVSFLAGGGTASPWIFLGGLVVLGAGLVAAGGSQAVERSRRIDLGYRGPSPVLAFVAVIALTLLAILLVLAPLSSLGLDPRSPLATTISLALTTLMYVAVLRLLVVGPGSLTWRDMGLLVPPRAAARDLLLGALLGVPVLVVTLAMGGVLARFLTPAQSPLPAAGTVTGLAFNLVSAAVLAPVGEELFFRGFATTAWARTIGNGPAIVRGAVFFALAHVVTLFDASFATGAQRALFSFVALLPVGLALGWLFLGRRSLYAAIGLHAAFDGLQVLALFAGWFG